ncbi:MAG: hypothetical protein LBJ80_01720 [Rickettsiales bacterium]|jgi:uncharacterized protein (DUF697 family)|nr:hypothetical protein [Rickettsiales bacterium]MDR1261125.1 hypothetical protein [Rickettsiales bacterium]
MSNLSENFKSSYKNFKQYAHNGTVPVEIQKDLSMVPQNCFYKSVDHINSVVGPVKNVTSNTTAITTFALTSIVLQPLYLAFAYLSYWPAKGLAKVTDKFGLKDNTESLVDYSNTLSEKALEHSGKVAEFVKTVLSYAISAVIWTAALVVTPITWAVDKVSSKFNESKTEAVDPKEEAKLPS